MKIFLKGRSSLRKSIFGIPDFSISWRESKRGVICGDIRALELPGRGMSSSRFYPLFRMIRPIFGGLTREPSWIYFFSFEARGWALKSSAATLPLGPRPWFQRSRILSSLTFISFIRETEFILSSQKSPSPILSSLFEEACVSPTSAA